MSLKNVDASTLKQWLESGEAVLVDVREPTEHAAEKITGATLLPLASVCKSALPEHAGKKLVIHCRKGARGNSACQKLLAEDPDLDMYNLQGGLDAWNEAGLRVACSGKRGLPLNQQVQLTIGLAVLSASLLGYFVHPAFMGIAAFFGLGLAFAGLTGFCGLARVLAKMPWNQ